MLLLEKGLQSLIVLNKSQHSAGKNKKTNHRKQKGGNIFAQIFSVRNIANAFTRCFKNDVMPAQVQHSAPARRQAFVQPHPAQVTYQVVAYQRLPISATPIRSLARRHIVPSPMTTPHARTIMIQHLPHIPVSRET
jgi:hypothetical protein